MTNTSKPNPITHNGRVCETCTNGDTVHANNVHRVTAKRYTAWLPCPAGCEHYLAIQPVGGTFQADLASRG
jgi:hypothetical protein